MKFGKQVDGVEKMTRAEIDAYILECMRKVKKRTIKKVYKHVMLISIQVTKNAK